MSTQNQLPVGDRYVLALAHEILARVLTSAAGLGDYRAVATAPEEGVRVILQIEQYEGPGIGRWTPSPEVINAEPKPTLRDIEENILAACTDVPQTLGSLASKSGYGNNPHFREAVYRLLELGLVIRIRGGIRLP